MYKKISIQNNNAKKSIDISRYDDRNTILERYCLENKDTLPIFFAFKDEDEINNLYKNESKKNIILHVLDIRNIIKKYKYEDIVNNNVTSSIFSSFDISKQTLGLLWLKYLHVDDSNDNIFEYLKQYNSKYFSTKNICLSNLKDFNEFIDKDRERIQKSLSQNDKYYKELQDNDEKQSFEVNPINVIEYTLYLKLTIEQGYRLIDVFDDLDCTHLIPYITYQSLAKKIQYYKIRKDGYYAPTWIQEKYNEYDKLNISEFIVLKILTSTKSQDMTNNYSNVILYIDTRSSILNIYIKVPEISNYQQANIKQSVLDVFGDRLQYEISNEKQTSIHAKFNITQPEGGFVFNKAIFADLVTNVSIVSYFLYFNEEVNTSLSKKRMGCYFKPNYTEFQSLGNKPLLFVPMPGINDQKQQYLEVNIYRAHDISQVMAFYRMFEKVLLLYMANQQSIIKEYLEIIPSFKNYLTHEKKKQTKKTKVKKTGQRADLLKTIHPEMFLTKYTSICQKHAQPYHMTKEEYDEKKEDFDTPDKVMEYPIGSGDYYACEPRDPSDKAKSLEFIWPSLRENKKLPNKDKFPYLPCCAKINQLEKNSNLKKYLESVGKIQKNTKHKQKKEMDYILGSNKILEEGRLGNLPFFLYELAKYVGYPFIVREKKKVLSLVRHGIHNSPDSILWCLEYALNSKFSLKDNESRQSIIQDTKNKLSDEKFIISKGETVGYTRKQLITILNSENQYIDPDIFIRTLEKYYSSVYGPTSIIVFKVDNEYPQGELSIPRYSLFPLKRPINKNNKFVLIVKFENESHISYPYNCELIGDFNSKTFVFSTASQENTSEMDFIKNVYKFYENQINLQCVYQNNVMKKYKLA
jgi:hypothetical protein